LRFHDLCEQIEGRGVRNFKDDMLVVESSNSLHSLFPEGFPLNEFIRNEKGDFE
jgi:hypothetical protein